MAWRLEEDHEDIMKGFLCSDCMDLKGKTAYQKLEQIATCTASRAYLKIVWIRRLKITIKACACGSTKHLL